MPRRMLIATLLLAPLAFLAIALTALPASAQVALKKKEDPTFIVIEIDDTSYVILQSDQLDTARKELEDKYRAEYDRWKIAKKKNPELKEPERQRITLAGTGFKDRLAAQEHIDKLQEKKAAKAAAPKKKPKEGRDR